MASRTVLLLAFCVATAAADPLVAQGVGDDLHQTVVDLDASVFGAFNDRDLDRFLELEGRARPQLRALSRRAPVRIAAWGS